jgi:hypothetical protein
MSCFQFIDSKLDCRGLYVAGDFAEFDKNMVLTSTWDYSSQCDLANEEIEYASLYCAGQGLHEACPSHLEERWRSASNKMKAYLNCFQNAKISLEEYCFYDMVPEHFLIEFFEVKNKITQHVIKNYPKPENYEFLLELTKLLYGIRERNLSLNFNNIDPVFLLRDSNKNIIKKMKASSGKIFYNLYGTRTGRLTTRPGSFPILTLKKDLRRAIEPKNDLFIELDYNAAELRTLLALLGKEQPKEDIHEWNAKNVFGGSTTRKNAKERIFAWLYNLDSKDYLANRTYNKNLIKEKYWNGKIVKTPFGRKIEADEFHALNYVIQSTTSDLFLRRAIAVDKLLKKAKSKITFLIHDSLIIDFANEDKDTLKQIIEEFSKTDLGDYKVNVSVGKNFGELKQIL